MEDYVHKVRPDAPSIHMPKAPAIGEQQRVHDVVLRRPDGSIVFERQGIRAPATWSQLAVRIVAQKYLLKRGVTPDDQGETDCQVMLLNVARTITDFGLRMKYFASPREAQEFQQALYARQCGQYGAFNSPVYFNVRHWHCYNIPGGSGNIAWNFHKGQPTAVERNYERPQASACFILGVRDSLCGHAGISATLASEARIFKYGSGAGANFSNLREKDAPLNVGGTSSGVISFLEVFDRQAGTIKSAGTTRRAAKMVILDDNHPDLREFVQWKVREERKAQALVAAGFSAGLDGEAYQSVSGQNANNSIRVSDDFLNAVEQGGSWDLRSRVGDRVTSTWPARQLFREMMEAAWSCGDPGLQFDDTINRWHTTPLDGRIRGSNPCSEYLSIDDSACNLASLRLTKFLRDDGTIDLDDLRDAVRTFILAQDILVDLSSYPTKAICTNAHEHRQLGLGYCDLSALLMRMGYGYDTEEGRNVAAAITAYITACAYEMSAEIAARMGPAEAYARNDKDVLRVLRQHQDAALRLSKKQHPELTLAAQAAWVAALHKATQYGVRNMQATLLAPTGTISFLMDATTTGVEPLLALVQEKDLVGGGRVTLENEELPAALRALGYDTAIPAICAWVREQGTLRGAPNFHAEHRPVFATALGEDALRPEAHVLMLAAVQPFLSGAISKTVNLPSTATVEDFERIAMLAWKSGVKCLAMYRDGCKGVQPVKAKTMSTEAPGPAIAASPEAFGRGSQKKLPPVRRGVTWGVTLEGHKVYVRSGEYPDGTLGEVFVDISQDGSTLGGLMGSWARSISIGLQYGVPLEEYVKSHLFTRFEPHGIVGKHPTIRMAASLTDLVVRVLAVHYLKRADLQHVDGETGPEWQLPLSAATKEDAPPAPVSAPLSGEGPACPTCGTLTVRNATCFRCPMCGESLGCS